MITPPASVSGRTNRLRRRGSSGSEAQTQRDRDEGKAEPERIDDQQQRTGERVGAERGEGECGRQVGPDARCPAETEDHADKKCAEHAASPQPLGELEALGAFEQADPDHADDGQAEEDHRDTADDLDDPSAYRPVGDARDPARGEAEEDEDDRESGDVEQRSRQEAEPEAVPFRVAELGGADPGNAREVGGQQRDRAWCEKGSEPGDEGREHRGNREHQPNVKV